MSFDPENTINIPTLHSRVPPAPEFAPETRFDDYELIEKLGQGGMGEIWRARDISGKREVAVKFVPREVADAEDEMERVEAMFQQVHGLQHEHICPLYVMKRTPGFGTYIVMKYIRGVTLGKFARGVRREHGAFPLKTLLEILRPVAAALDYAHKNNVVHRDIKPGNIMVAGDPKTLEVTDIQIIDFGLAATFRASLSRVSQQKFSNSGTRPYMAPEQWKGQFQDAATDQYALGVTAYEILAGVLPFDSDDAEALRLCVLNEPPLPIPGQAAGVNAAIRQALAKERKERFFSCRQFVAVMEKDGGDGKTELPPPPKDGNRLSPKISVRLGETDLPALPLGMEIPPEIAERLGISEDGKTAWPTKDIRNEELAYLRNLPGLQTLDLRKCTDVTNDRMWMLRQTLPECKIWTDRNADMGAIFGGIIGMLIGGFIGIGCGTAFGTILFAVIIAIFGATVGKFLGRGSDEQFRS